MIDKRIWGPHLWYSIHFIAMGFPNDASSIDKKNYKNFFINIPNVIPCEECSKHFIETLNNYPIDNYLNSREKLFEWTVIIHNEVNKLLGKEVWNLKKAKHHYKNFNFKSEEVKKSNNKAFFIILLLLFIIIGLLFKNNLKLFNLNIFKNLI